MRTRANSAATKKPFRTTRTSPRIIPQPGWAPKPVGAGGAGAAGRAAARKKKLISALHAGAPHPLSLGTADSGGREERGRWVVSEGRRSSPGILAQSIS